MIVFQDEKYLQVGRFLKTKGLDGAIVFTRSINEIEELVFDKNLTLYINIGLNMKPISIKKISNSGSNFIFLLNEVSSIEHASVLVQKNIFIKRNDLDLEIIPDDLVGYSVFTGTSSKIGIIIDIGDYGSGTLLEIQNDKSRSTEMIRFDNPNMTIISSENKIILHDPEI